MRAYSEDIRVRVLHAYENREGSQRQIANRFEVSLVFVGNLLRRYRNTDSIQAKRYAGPTFKIDYESLKLIRDLVDDNPCLPLSILSEELATSAISKLVARQCGEQSKNTDLVKQDRIQLQG